MPSLEKRLSSARQAVEQRRSARPLSDLEAAVAALPQIRPFTEAMSGEEIDFVLRLKDVDSTLLRTAEDHEVAGLAASVEPLAALHRETALPLLLTDVYPWYETGPLALRRPPETRNPEAGLPPTEGPASGDRVTQDGQPGGFLPPPPQA